MRDSRHVSTEVIDHGPLILGLLPLRFFPPFSFSLFFMLAAVCDSLSSSFSVCIKTTLNLCSAWPNMLPLSLSVQLDIYSSRVRRSVDPHLTLFFFNHACVYVCVSSSVCHLDVCFPRFCSIRHWSACMCAGRTQQEGFHLVLRLAVGTERKIGKTIQPPHPLPPTQNTQVSSTLISALTETWNP